MTDDFVKRAGLCVAPGSVSTAAYGKNASLHEIRDALDLNFCLCRHICDFLRIHHD